MSEKQKNPTWIIIRAALGMLDAKVATPEQVVRALCFALAIVGRNEKIAPADLHARLEAVTRELLISLGVQNGV